MSYVSLSIFNLFAFSLTVFSSTLASALPERTAKIFRHHEQQCLNKGWQKLNVQVRKTKRKLLYKKPPGQIKGIIITLHGGGGAYSNFCSNIWLGKPMVEFSELALENGFAVFSLDSGWNSFTDNKGNPCGKRWASQDLGNKTNSDLQFIRKVLNKTIPQHVPQEARQNIFMTGISNGGYMTILAATSLHDKIRAFAPVSAGNPYSLRIDCARRFADRLSAPGRFYHKNGNLINREGACRNMKGIRLTLNVKKGATPFKQFHHKGDLLVDLSCMREAEKFLPKYGYINSGPFILDDGGGRRLWKHFWLKRYNKPIIDFFISHLKQNT